MEASDTSGTPAPMRPLAGGCPDLHHARLANGLDVLVVANPVVPLVTLEIDVRNGAYTETPEFDGLSHLYEHMFFKANERLPDQEAYLRRTRQLGMEWNGTTSEERVNYYFTLQSRDLDAGLRFLADAIRTPLFLQEELERERQVVLGEYDRAEADPGFHLHRAVSRQLWHAHYSRKNVIGTRSVIESATREQMFRIRDRFYVPNNSLLLVAGDIGTRDALERVEAAFGDWCPGSDPFAADPVPQHPPMRGSTHRVVERPVHAATLLVAWHGPSVEHEAAATHAADVLGFVLGQRNSRFYRRLVESGLAAQASVHYQTLRFTGPVQAYVVTDPERVEAAHAALLQEIEALAGDDAFTDEELEHAKTQLEIEQVYDAERPSQIVHTLGYWWAVSGLEYYLNYRRDLRRVTPADVQAFARDYLVGRPRASGVLVAPEARARLGALAVEVDA